MIRNDLSQVYRFILDKNIEQEHSYAFEKLEPQSILRHTDM